MIFGPIATFRKFLSKHPAVSAFFVSFVLLLMFYPRFFLMQEFPYIQTTWELTDPAVSTWIMLPSLRVMKYELFHNHNFLWTNLRSLGLPLLGNEIQGAPIFPLTLLCLWIPEPYFWNVFILCRLLLGTAGAFLLGTQCLRLSRHGATVFAVSFGLSFFALRWMNHPWQNGFFAGIWYLYFALRAMAASREKFDRQRIGAVLGLGLATYSLVTCGFPEGAALAGLLAFLVVLPPFLIGVIAGRVRAGIFLLDLVLAHVIGLAASSPQIFAVLEFIGLHPPPYRAGTGGGQFEGIAAITPMLERLADGRASGVTVHFFHLAAVCLCLLGLFRTFRSRLSAFDGSAILCLTFFILKFFPVWPWFNSVVASIPVLKESWFIVYFFPIPIWFFAYYAAKGTSSLTATWFGRASLVDKVLFVIAVLAPAILLFVSINSGIPFTHRRINRHIAMYAVFVITVLGVLIWPRLSKFRPRLMAWVVLFVIVEAIAALPRHFLPYGSSEYEKDYNHATASRVGELIVSKGFSLLDGRERSGGGDYVAAGLATLDNGSPPILTERLWELRKQAFIPVSDPFGPQIIFKDQRLPYGYKMVSTRFYIDHLVERISDQTRHLASPELEKLGEVGEFGVYFDPTALSRAYHPSRCISVNKATALGSVFSPEKYKLGFLFVENLNAAEQTFCNTYSSPYQTLAIASDRGDQLNLPAIQGPSIVVLNDNYYPGWQAIDRSNGAELQIKPANYAFRALLLPEPRVYDIEFLYRPQWLQKAVLLMLLSAVLILLLLVKFKKSR